MILGANHIAISVPDMEQALEFYCGLLGFEIVKDAGWPSGNRAADQILAVPDTSARAVHIKTQNLVIELFQFGNCDPKKQDPNRPVIDHGYTHLCLAVTDVDAVYEKLSAAGVKFHSKPVKVGPGVRTVYGRDPFGNVLEFEEVEGRKEPHQSALAS